MCLLECFCFDFLIVYILYLLQISLFVVPFDLLMPTFFTLYNVFLAMELTLAMEKLVNEKLLHLHKVSVFSTPYILDVPTVAVRWSCLENSHNMCVTLLKVAEEAGDAQLSDFVEGEFLKPQVCMELIAFG